MPSAVISTVNSQNLHITIKAVISTVNSHNLHITYFGKHVY